MFNQQFVKTKEVTQEYGKFIKAMGGDLEIIATFPDGSVQISQFENISKKREEISRVWVETCEGLATIFFILYSAKPS